MSQSKDTAEEVCRLLKRHLELAQHIRDAGKPGQVNAVLYALSPHLAISRTTPPEPRGTGSPNERSGRNEDADAKALDDLEKLLTGLLERLAKARKQELPADDKRDVRKSGA